MALSTFLNNPEQKQRRTPRNPKSKLNPRVNLLSVWKNLLTLQTLVKLSKEEKLILVLTLTLSRHVVPNIGHVAFINHGSMQDKLARNQLTE